MTTVFQVILSKNDKRFFINNVELLQNMYNSLTISPEDFLTKNLNIIENDIKFIKKQLKKIEFNDDSKEHCFSINRIHDNIDSKIMYIYYPEVKNLNNDSQLFLTNNIEEEEENNYIEELCDEKNDIDLSEEYVKYYKFGENETKENIFRIAKENKNNMNILIGLVDGIISRNKDNILNGFLKQYGTDFTNDILFPSLEHAICLNNENDTKIIIKNIDKKDEFLEYHKNDSINFLKNKNINYEILNSI